MRCHAWASKPEPITLASSNTPRLGTRKTPAILYLLSTTASAPDTPYIFSWTPRTPRQRQYRQFQAPVRLVFPTMYPTHVTRLMMRFLIGERQWQGSDKSNYLIMKTEFRSNCIYLCGNHLPQQGTQHTSRRLLLSSRKVEVKACYGCVLSSSLIAQRIYH